MAVQRDIHGRFQVICEKIIKFICLSRYLLTNPSLDGIVIEDKTLS